VVKVVALNRSVPITLVLAALLCTTPPVVFASPVQTGAIGEGWQSSGDDDEPSVQSPPVAAPTSLDSPVPVTSLADSDPKTASDDATVRADHSNVEPLRRGLVRILSWLRCMYE
jgi:hypothetical protein